MLPLDKVQKRTHNKASAAIKCKKLMPHGEIISIKQTAWFIAFTHQCQCAAWLLTVPVGCMLRSFRALQLACMGKTLLHQAWFSPTLVSTSSVFKSWTFAVFLSLWAFCAYSQTNSSKNPAHKCASTLLLGAQCRRYNLSLPSSYVLFLPITSC